MGEPRFTAPGFADAWAAVLGAIALGALATALAPRGWWLAGLVDTFPQIHGLVAVLAAVIALARGRRGVALGLGILAAVHAGRVLPDAVPRGSAAPPADVRLLLANVHGPSTDYEAVIAEVRAADPDVVVLVETTFPWVGAMGAALEEWPYRLEVPRTDHFGMAAYSRLPLTGDGVYLGGVPAIRAVVEVGEAELDLFAVHTLPPKSRGYFAVREEQLDQIAAVAGAMGAHAVVAGDLNIVPWAGAFRGVLREGRLRDSRVGFGVHGTWPSPLPAPLRIPIDHVLVRGLGVVGREVTGDIGSDHRGVVVDLRIQ